MSIDFKLKNGNGIKRYAAVDSLHRIETVEIEYPLENIDIVDTSQTIRGRTLVHDAADDEPVWQLYRTTTDGVISSSEFAGNGKFNLRWSARLTAFAAPLFNNQFSMLFGSADHVLIGDESEVDFSELDPFSLSVWFKTSSTAQQAIISKQGASNNSGYRLCVQSNEIRWHLSGGSASNRMEIQTQTGSTGNLSDGTWHHVVIIKAGGSSAASAVTIIVDGVDQVGNLDTPTDGLVSTSSTLTGFQIAGRNLTTNPMIGLIDEPSAWSAAVTVADAQRWYNNGKPTNLLVDPENDTNATLIGWWSMGDFGGVTGFPTIANRAGTGNNLDGTAVNMDVSAINVDVP